MSTIHEMYKREGLRDLAGVAASASLMHSFCILLEKIYGSYFSLRNLVNMYTPRSISGSKIIFRLLTHKQPGGSLG